MNSVDVREHSQSAGLTALVQQYFHEHHWAEDQLVSSTSGTITNTTSLLQLEKSITKILDTTGAQPNIRATTMKIRLESVLLGSGLVSDDQERLDTWNELNLDPNQPGPSSLVYWMDRYKHYQEKFNAL